ncbi:DCC1-like thiol-disulfide oxidoreductase family protein [Singulisphaera sp. Ch08]|uniref:DCC1-like thiol-disulfide oxidoreductase family protein n=1 Tax=Singulisphaera sp. Ch08 TaxID=3120278 RepID=A0AAU7CEK2_9BACT
MRRLFVLYDDRCGLCTWARRWLTRQPAFLEFVFIPKGSAWALRLFPDLSSPDSVDDLVVVSDVGGVYGEARAWIMCLYALVEYREWSLRLAQPLLYPLARETFALISTGRQRLSAWLNLASEAEIADALRRFQGTACAIQAPEALHPSNAPAVD